MELATLYERSQGSQEWDNMGSGHVTIEQIEGSGEIVLSVVDEDDNDTLLLCQNITPNDIFTNEEVIIKWRDSGKALDLALSFHKAEGCLYIWEKLHNLREDLQSKMFHPKKSTEAGQLNIIQASKYQKFVDSSDKREITSMGHTHMRKKADERGLDMEEEENSNTDRSTDFVDQLEQSQVANATELKKNMIPEAAADGAAGGSTADQTATHGSTLVTKQVPEQSYEEVEKLVKVYLLSAASKERNEDPAGARADYQFLHSKLCPGLLEAIVKHSYFEHRMGNEHLACIVYEKAIEAEKEKEHSKLLPLLLIQYSRFCYTALHNPVKARGVLDGLYGLSSITKTSLQDVISLVSICPFEKTNGSLLDSLVSDFLKSGPAEAELTSESDKEEISSMLIEFFYKYGDTESIKIASERHKSLFSSKRSKILPSVKLARRKRKAHDSVISNREKVAKTGDGFESVIGSDPVAPGQTEQGYAQQMRSPGLAGTQANYLQQSWAATWVESPAAYSLVSTQQLHPQQPSAERGVQYPHQPMTGTGVTATAERGVQYPHQPMTGTGVTATGATNEPYAYTPAQGYTQQMQSAGLAGTQANYPQQPRALTWVESPAAYSLVSTEPLHPQQPSAERGVQYPYQPMTGTWVTATGATHGQQPLTGTRMAAPRANYPQHSVPYHQRPDQVSQVSHLGQPYGDPRYNPYPTGRPPGYRPSQYYGRSSW
ncbi:uncharacterized protein LOC124698844 [Lolium rigidum]|uniref:uncharacterized protein LOC124698844 n=1 Tax=Lolium rigidum TaxID=89674 RepID=UPI001F5E2655|nr:uncharacterized protein LOC124698844 [Lolium rigidum]